MHAYVCLQAGGRRLPGCLNTQRLPEHPASHVRTLVASPQRYRECMRVLYMCTCAGGPPMPICPCMPMRSDKASSALFFKYNTQLGPPYQVLVDTNFINFSIKNKACASKPLTRNQKPHDRENT